MPNIKSQSDDLTGKLREAGFNMPLPSIVEGMDSDGNPFKEETVLSYISHSGSSFWLKTRVSVGGELRLNVELPRNLSEDKSLRLIIKGTILFMESSEEDSDRHRVSLRFKNKYIIDENK